MSINLNAKIMDYKYMFLMAFNGNKIKEKKLCSRLNAKL